MRHVFLIITWKGQYLRKLLPKKDDIGFFWRYGRYEEGQNKLNFFW